MTRSFWPNHTFATDAGAFIKNGYPIAAKAYPVIQAQGNPI